MLTGRLFLQMPPQLTKIGPTRRQVANFIEKTHFMDMITQETEQNQQDRILHFPYTMEV